MAFIKVKTARQFISVLLSDICTPFCEHGSFHLLNRAGFINISGHGSQYLGKINNTYISITLDITHTYVISKKFYWTEDDFKLSEDMIPHILHRDNNLPAFLSYDEDGKIIGSLWFIKGMNIRDFEHLGKPVRFYYDSYNNEMSYYYNQQQNRLKLKFIKLSENKLIEATYSYNDIEFNYTIISNILNDKIEHELDYYENLHKYLTPEQFSLLEMIVM